MVRHVFRHFEPEFDVPIFILAPCDLYYLKQREAAVSSPAPSALPGFLNPFAQLRSQDLPNMARDRQEDLSSATVLVYNLASGKAINSRFFGYCRLMNVEYC